MGVLRRQAVFCAVAVSVLAAVSGAASLPAAASPPAAHQITWLAAGDSYASGQGLPNPAGLCARGTGSGGSGSTWAISAAAQLRVQGIAIANSDPDLVACTGAITADLMADNSKKLGPKHKAQWNTSMGRNDLVTFSFGGDDVGFAGIMTHCEEFGCPSTNDVEAKIAAMANTGVTIKGVKTDPYHAFLENVAKDVVVKGGNIVVMGYPELVEDVGLWRPGRTTCAGMSAGEVQRVRSWAGDMNATIGSAVATVNALPSDQRNDVHLTFIDVVSGQNADGISPSDPNLFEPSSGTRHELCSQGGQPWINNEIKTYKSRSFHPNQAGDNAMGRLAAEVISQLRWPWAPWDSTPVNAPTGLASLVPWGQNGVGAPWIGCSLYLPTISGTALQGAPSYYVATASGDVPEATPSDSGPGGAIWYSIDFNNAMGEIVLPPGTQSPWLPPDGITPTITTYSDGSTAEYWATDSDFDLITIPGQPCKYEVMSVTDYPPPQSTFFALVNSLRPIKGATWGG